MRLSRLLNPPGKLVELSVRALEFGFTAQLERSPDDAALFKQFPGLDRAILDALRPILTRHVTAEIPAIDRRSAEFFAERFSPAELDRLIEFYSSLTGTKLIQGMYAGADLGKLMDGIDKSGNSQLRPGHLDDFTRSTVTRFYPILDKSDEAYLAKFGKTPLFVKLQAALPDFQKLMSELASAPTPELDAEMEKAVDRVVEEFLRRQAGRTST